MSLGTHQEQRRLLKSVGIISFYTLLSRILGFVRDMVLAHAFGAGMGADAFFVAQKLPNFLRRLFAEGAFNTAFVPVFSDYLAQGDEEATRRMSRAVFTILFLVLLVVVIGGELLMPWLVMVLAPGFLGDPDKYQLTVDLSRITFPYILFISLVSLSGGILNSHHRFAVPAATPILLNVALILGATMLAPLCDPPVLGLAIGLFLGGVIQLGLQWPFLSRVGLPFRFLWDPNHPAVRRILDLMGPSVIGASVAQVNLVIDLILASWLPVGSISYLYYADRLVEFPNGLIGIALGTAILPTLSAKAARGDLAGCRIDLDFALRLVILINLPATVGLILLREPLLALLFERGAFDPETTRLTAQALLAFGLGLLPFSAVKVIAPAFFAIKDTRTPVKVAIVCMAANLVMNLILMFPLKHAGMALATTLASYLNMYLLLHYLGHRMDYRPGRAILRTFGKSIVASIAMSGFILWSLEVFWGQAHSTLARAGILLPIILGAMVVFAVFGWLVRLDEIQELRRMLRRPSPDVAPPTNSNDDGMMGDP